MMRFWVLIPILLLPTFITHAETSEPVPQVGDTYEITRVQESSEQTDGQGSGSSYDKDTIIEHVIAVRGDGLELEYDLPTEASRDERASVWQFPVRVFKPNHGPLQLLNRTELEARVDRWLKEAKWPRTVCGHWIFTWNAFRIDCDPQSAIRMIEPFDLRSAELRDGAPYQEAEARSPGTLTRKNAGPDGSTFVVEMAVDPDIVRRAQAESDVATGEIMRKPVTLEAALRERAKELVSGTILVTFEADLAGDVRRRTRVTKLETRQPDGKSETRTVTETVERRRVSTPK